MSRQKGSKNKPKAISGTNGTLVVKNKKMAKALANHPRCAPENKETSPPWLTKLEGGGYAIDFGEAPEWFKEYATSKNKPHADPEPAKGLLGLLKGDPADKGLKSAPSQPLSKYMQERQASKNGQKG